MRAVALFGLILALNGSAEDAMVSVDRLRSRGAAITVTTFDGFDHINSWIHAMPRAVTDFASLAR